jgi:hypothetical protein
MNKTAAITALSIALSGCAVASRGVPTSAVPYTQYRNYDCEMLANESERLAARIHNLGARLDEAAQNDQGIMAVSLLLFWPAAFALGNKSQEAEYSYLKGQSDAVQQAAIMRKCDGTIPALSTALQGAPGAAPTTKFRPASCDWPGTKQGVGAC